MKNITKKILISGATGLIGSRLLRRLLAQNFVVHTIGRSQKDTYFYNFVDMNQDLPILHGKYDLFIHCAWYTVHPHFWHSKYNLAFYRNSAKLIEGMLTQVRKMVIFGTCAEYDELNSKELDNYKLGASKLSLRRALFNMCALERILWLPVFFAYGEGEPESKILSQIKAQKLKKEDIRSLDAVRDFIHFEDVAEMVWELIRQNRSGVHDIGTGYGVRIGNIFESKTSSFYQHIRNFNGAGDVKIAKIEEVFWSQDEITRFESRFKNYITLRNRF